MNFFRKNQCRMFFNEKTKKFNLKGFSMSFENTLGKTASGSLGEIDFSSIPPDVSDRLRTQSEIHFQICNTLQSLPETSPEKIELTVKFANHLMEVEKTLIHILSDQKKKSQVKKS